MSVIWENANLNAVNIFNKFTLFKACDLLALIKEYGC